MSNYSRSRQEINRLQKVYTPVRSRNKGSMTRGLSQPKINGSEANSGVKTLAQFLSMLGAIEIEIESLKRSLTKMHDFNSYRFFNHLSQNQRQLSPRNLMRVIEKGHYALKPQDLQQILKMYLNGSAASSKVAWVYSDYLKFLYSTPQQLHEFLVQEELNQETKKNSRMQQINFQQLELGFVLILLKESEFNYTLKQMTLKLSKSSKSQLFGAITQSHCITACDIISFVLENRLKMSRQAAQSILTRCDKDLDGVISFCEFSALLNSEGPSQIYQKPETKLQEALIKLSSGSQSTKALPSSSSKCFPLSGSKYSNLDTSLMSNNYTDQRQWSHYGTPQFKDSFNFVQVNQQKCSPLKKTRPSNNHLSVARKLNFSGTRSIFSQSQYNSAKSYHSRKETPKACLSEVPTNTKKEYSEPIQETKIGQSLDDFETDSLCQEELIVEQKEEDGNGQGITSEYQALQNDQSLNPSITIQDNLFEVLEQDPSMEDSIDQLQLEIGFQTKESQTHQEFQKYLQTLITAERKVDTFRINLILQPEFDFVEAYKSLDLQLTGQITAEILRIGLQDKLQMVASKREIQLIMQRFDHNKDGKLRFSDFCDIITPHSPPNYVARIIQNKFHFVPKETVMAEKTKDGLKEVLTQIIQLEMDLEMIRYRLQSIDNEPFENAPFERLFSELDTKERGYLNKERISDYLIQKNINFEGDRELGYVLSRFDTIQSGKINFNEFEKELTPKTSFSQSY